MTLLNSVWLSFQGARGKNPMTLESSSTLTQIILCVSSPPKKFSTASVKKPFKLQLKPGTIPHTLPCYRSWTILRYQDMKQNKNSGPRIPNLEIKSHPMLFYIPALIRFLGAEHCPWSKHFPRQKRCDFTSLCQYYQTSWCQLLRI